MMRMFRAKLSKQRCNLFCCHTDNDVFDLFWSSSNASERLIGTPFTSQKQPEKDEGLYFVCSFWDLKNYSYWISTGNSGPHYKIMISAIVAIIYDWTPEGFNSFYLIVVIVLAFGFQLARVRIRLVMRRKAFNFEQNFHEKGKRKIN